MAQNPHNAVMHLGHANGTVTLWSPSMTTPLVKMLCHRGPVQALAVDRGGNYMATSGLDGQLKIWDIRKYQVVQEYYTPTPASSLSISQMGLLAVGWGPHVSVSWYKVEMIWNGCCYWYCTLDMERCFQDQTKIAIHEPFATIYCYTRPQLCSIWWCSWFWTRKGNFQHRCTRYAHFIPSSCAGWSCGINWLKFQDLESPTLTVWNPTYSKRRSRDKKWKFTVFWIR